MAWWAELFELPCVGYAASLDEVGPLAQAGADFVALGDWIWTQPARRRPPRSRRPVSRILERAGRASRTGYLMLAATCALTPPRRPAPARNRQRDQAPDPPPRGPSGHTARRRFSSPQRLTLPATAAAPPSPTSPTARFSAATTSPPSRLRPTASSEKATRRR